MHPKSRHTHNRMTAKSDSPQGASMCSVEWDGIGRQRVLERTWVPIAADGAEGGNSVADTLKTAIGGHLS